MDETPNTPLPQGIRPENPIAHKVRDDIKNWIEEVSVVRPELGGFSICPFAKKANYKIIQVDIDALYPVEGFDVVIYILEESDLETIQWWVEFYNKKYPDWMFFEDCASYDTYINGVKTNNGKYNLILGQPKEELLKFREALKKTSYYSNWSKEYYQEIVGD